MAGCSKGRFSVRRSQLPTNARYALAACEIVSEENLPGSDDVIIHARRKQYHCLVIWDPVRGILRSPWSHDDDRCEVIAWGREGEDIAAVGNWTTHMRVLFERKREAVEAYQSYVEETSEA